MWWHGLQNDYLYCIFFSFTYILYIPLIINLYAYSHVKYMLPQLCLFVEVFAYGEMFCTCAALQNLRIAQCKWHCALAECQLVDKWPGTWKGDRGLSQSAYLCVLVFSCTCYMSSVADQVLSQFKVHIKPSMLKIPGCVLAPPILSSMHRWWLVDLVQPNIPECVSSKTQTRQWWRRTAKKFQILLSV